MGFSGINDEDDKWLGCPLMFRENCANYDIRCNDCKAYEPACTALRYSPIQKGGALASKKHPALKASAAAAKQKAKVERKAKQADPKSAMVKSALKSEKKTIEGLGGRLTVGSGRVFNDGDGTCKIRDNTYSIEYKRRFSDKGSFTITRVEYYKGISQGCSIFITDCGKDSTVTMSKDTFLDLIS